MLALTDPMLYFIWVILIAQLKNKFWIDIYFLLMEFPYVNGFIGELQMGNFKAVIITERTVTVFAHNLMKPSESKSY